MGLWNALVYISMSRNDNQGGHEQILVRARVTVERLRVGENLREEWTWNHVSRFCDKMCEH